MVVDRIVALLDPNDVSFATPPPHWKDPQHERVREGMAIAFGDVLIAWSETAFDPSGILSLVFASLVYHSGWLIEIKTEYEHHPFNKLAILDNIELLEELRRDHLTLDANDNVGITAGVSPHISQAKNDLASLVGGQRGTHSLRKGAHTKLNCGSTGGPTAAAACIRSGYSMGTNLDLYLMGEAASDHFTAPDAEASEAGDEND